MKYIHEYRDPVLVKRLLEKIHQLSIKPVRLMEVCGSHTMAVHKFGLPTLLPSGVELVSGPGCPVCVSDLKFIDTAIEYARKGYIIATFGDLLRVPGSTANLDKVKSEGGDIRLVFSSLDALELARQNPGRQVIFLAIGFETTTPGTAVAILQAAKFKIRNFKVLVSHKIMPPAMAALVEDDVAIDGYLAPGHVSVITGAGIYAFIAKRFRLPVVVAGFEPIDILQGILMLLQQIISRKPAVEIQYRRVVNWEGNRKAQRLIDLVFETRDDYWRGLGMIPGSGMQLRKSYEKFDIQVSDPVVVNDAAEPKGCICGEILKGLKQPSDCKLFAKACTPENPVGACMVSGEGTCQAAFKYRDLALILS